MLRSELNKTGIRLINYKIMTKGIKKDLGQWINML